MRSSFCAVAMISVVCSLAAQPAQAAIQLTSTRAIMNESDASVSVYARNVTELPFVVQTWMEGPQGQMETPFFVTPPLSRFDGGAERGLNITRVQNDLPGDRESQFWLNVLEVPQKAADGGNTLSIATRTRIKFFYRPTSIRSGLRGPEQLNWEVAAGGNGNGCELVAHNGSPFIVNFSRVRVPGLPDDFGMGSMAMPFADLRLALPQCPAGAVKIEPLVINDYGAIETWPAVEVGHAAPSVGQMERQGER